MNSLRSIGVDYDSSESDELESEVSLSSLQPVSTKFGLVSTSEATESSQEYHQAVGDEQGNLPKNGTTAEAVNNNASVVPEQSHETSSSGSCNAQPVEDKVTISPGKCTTSVSLGCDSVSKEPCENHEASAPVSFTPNKDVLMRDIEMTPVVAPPVAGEGSTIAAVAEADSSEDSSDSDISAVYLSDDSTSGVKAFAANTVKTKDEVLPCELPVEKLTISLPEDAVLAPAGIAKGIVEDMIVIEGLPDAPPLSHDTVFFNAEKLVIGKVFDVFGPVKRPYYSIRLQSQENDAPAVAPGDEIYFAPLVDNLTDYVFVQQLARIKGSDASWKFDQEPPPEHLEYSDDEAEASAKSASKNENRAKRQQNPMKGQKNINRKPVRANTPSVIVEGLPRAPFSGNQPNRQAGYTHVPPPNPMFPPPVGAPPPWQRFAPPPFLPGLHQRLPPPQLCLPRLVPPPMMYHFAPPPLPRGAGYHYPPR